MEFKGLLNKTYYYKTFYIGGVKYKAYMEEKMSNDEFNEIVFYVRRIFGYAMYPRWFCARIFLSEVLEVLKRNGLYKHKIRQKANILLKEFDAFEKVHKIDFDEEWMDLLGGEMANKIMPKINDLRGAVGGVLMQQGVKNYILYSYPETLCIICDEGVIHHDMLMKEVEEKFKINFGNLFSRLRGEKVLASSYSLMCAVEDLVKEPLPSGVDARGSGADIKLRSLERALVDEDVIRKSINGAYNEMGIPNEKIAEILGAKYNVRKSH